MLDLVLVSSLSWLGTLVDVFPSASGGPGLSDGWTSVNTLSSNMLDLVLVSSPSWLGTLVDVFPSASGGPGLSDGWTSVNILSSNMLGASCACSLFALATFPLEHFSWLSACDGGGAVGGSFTLSVSRYLRNFMRTVFWDFDKLNLSASQVMAYRGQHVLFIIGLYPYCPQRRQPRSTSSS